jgi:hypothetical protein
VAASVHLARVIKSAVVPVPKGTRP